MDLTPGENYPIEIKELRRRLGLTQVMLAERMGVSFPTVNRWENGKSVPSQLSWTRLLELSGEIEEGVAVTRSAERLEPPVLDFTSKPAVVAT